MYLWRGQVQILVEKGPILLPACARTICNLAALALQTPEINCMPNFIFTQGAELISLYPAEFADFDLSVYYIFLSACHFGPFLF